MAALDLSICIVNWNAREFLGPCLDSIKARTNASSYETIVVDNHSSDGSAPFLRKRLDVDKLILNESNVGFARASNQALQFCSGRYVVLLNPDTELLTDALSAMAGFLDGNREYAAVGCRLVNTDGSVQYTGARTFPTLRNQFCYFYLLHRVFPGQKTLSSEDLDYWDHRSSRAVDVVSGACMMVRKKVMNDLGGLDESLFMYGEDLDLCYRIKKRGGRIYYLSDEKVLHHSGGSSSKNRRKLLVAIMLREAHYSFMRKHYGQAAAFLYRLVALSGCTIRLMVLALQTSVYLIMKPGDLGKSTASVNKCLATILWSAGLYRKSILQQE